MAHAHWISQQLTEPARLQPDAGCYHATCEDRSSHSHQAGSQASLRFYVNRLGFTSPWRYEEDGKARVGQVERQGCALILADTWPEKIGKGLILVSVNVEQDTREAAIAALDALRGEPEAKGVPVKEGSWGYRLLVVDHPDGNQLFFNYPNETASGKIVTDEA
jgi:hypothetical protein